MPTPVDDGELAFSLLLAARLEKLSLGALVARLDEEIARRPGPPPPWLIEASLCRDLPSLLAALTRVSSEGSDSDARVAQVLAMRIAAGVLERTISPIVAARKLSGLLRRAAVPDDDPDLLTMVAIDSETDALPMGAVRQEWDARALVRKDAEIERAEAWAYGTGEAAFRNLALRWRAGAERIR